MKTISVISLSLLLLSPLVAGDLQERCDRLSRSQDQLHQCGPVSRRPEVDQHAGARQQHDLARDIVERHFHWNGDGVHGNLDRAQRRNLGQGKLAAARAADLYRDQDVPERLYETLVVRAAIGARRGDFVAADTALAEAARLESPDWPPQWRARLAFAQWIVALRAGRHAEARAHAQRQADLNRAAGIPVGEQRALGNVATCDAWGGEPARAVPALRAVIAELDRLGAGLAAGHMVYNLVEALRRTGEFDEALTQALHLDPHHDAAHAWRALARRRESATPSNEVMHAMLADFDTAIEIQPDHVGYHLYRAEVRLGAGDFAGAAADCSFVLAREPESGEAHALRGIARQRLGDSAGAVEDCTAAIDREAASADVYLARAFAQENLDSGEEALGDCDAPLELNPQDAVACNLRGTIRLKMGDVDEAAEDFEAAVIRTALKHTHGRRIDAATRLGVGRNTITRKIQELKLEED